MAGTAIEIEGLRELQAALKAFPAVVAREFRKDMRAAVEPARQAVEGRMGTDISHMKAGSPWIKARTGVSGTAVYIVPKERGVSGNSSTSRKRPNFAPLAMSRAYLPAQEEAAAGLVRAAEAAVAKAARSVS